jgi:hypothetical protein
MEGDDDCLGACTCLGETFFSGALGCETGLLLFELEAVEFSLLSFFLERFFLLFFCLFVDSLCWVFDICKGFFCGLGVATCLLVGVLLFFFLIF